MNLTKKIQEFHKMGREHYDTPGSIKYCACDSCNEARRVVGRSEKHWDEKPGEIKYLLSVDEDIWAAFKSKCALGKMKIKDVFAEMIQKFISKEE